MPRDNQPDAGAETTRRTALAAILGGLLAPSMGERHAHGTRAIASVDLFRSIKKLHISSDIQYLRTAGHSVSGSGAALYRRISDSNGPAHPYQTLDASGSLWELAEDVITPQMVGPVGGADDYLTFHVWAEATVALKRRWLIPPGEYVLNGAGELRLTTGGTCRGRLVIPKSNVACRIAFVRDKPGEVLDCAGWGAMARGAQNIGAANAAKRHLFLNSSEILIDRDGGASAPYTKQEFVRCDDKGAFTTPLTCTYSDPAKLVATAYEPSIPITIDGLQIHRTGAPSTIVVDRGVISCQRDSVTFDNLVVINDEPEHPTAVMVEIGYCADVVFNRVTIRGANDVVNGLGYGLLFATTIGCRVRSPDILDCREAISGRHNSDLHVTGGRCSYAIDDHWGNRMRIEGTTIECVEGGAAVQYAGHDIVLSNVRQHNGRSLLAIRNDTPSLGGTVLISSPTVTSRYESEYYLFSLSSPNGTESFLAAQGESPFLPDVLTLDGGSIDIDARVAWLAYLAVVRTPHRNWGDVSITGTWHFSGSALKMGVILFKDSNYQTSRSTRITVAGPVNFDAGYAVYVTAADRSDRQAAIVRVTGLGSGNLRLSGFGVAELTVDGGSLGSIEDDEPTQTRRAPLFQFNRVKLRGGFIRPTLVNLRFVECIFIGNYTVFPASGNVDLDNSSAKAGVSLPEHVRQRIRVID